MQTVVPASAADFPSNLLSEWNEFFSKGAYCLLLPLFLNITGSAFRSYFFPVIHGFFCSEKPSLGAADAFLLPALCSAVSLCPLQHLEKHQLPAKLTADDDSGLPDDLLTLMNHFCPLLMNSHRCVQIAAFRVVFRYSPLNLVKWLLWLMNNLSIQFDSGTCGGNER
jgi:hypothetical protein